MYDDKLTGQLYDDPDTALAQDVVEVTVYQLPPGMFYPCLYDRQTMRILYKTRDTEMIAEFLAALPHKQ